MVLIAICDYGNDKRMMMMMTMIYDDYDNAPREQFWPVDNRVVEYPHKGAGYVVLRGCYNGMVWY